jgi:enoyl-CoA hydratase/carnithine racemase
MAEGMQKGLLDETVPPDSLLSRAQEKAVKLSEIPSDTFRLVKRQIREPYLANTERSKIRDEETLNVWCSPQTRGAIREYLRRTLGK